MATYRELVVHDLEEIRTKIIVRMSWLEEMNPDDQDAYDELEAQLARVEAVIETFKQD